ncbi:LysR family transcriptional regulator [Bacillus subtilis]|nr:LysR family transcriptional regulator [Bacillus subtilis]
MSVDSRARHGQLSSLIETQDLVLFLAVARAGSISGGAANLGMAAPSVSTRIAGIERRLGATILQRGARGSSLTPAGERLAVYAERCLALLDEAAHNVPAQQLSRFVLAAPASIGDTLFELSLMSFEGASLKVHCRVAHSGETVARILDGSVDAGFVISKVPLQGLRNEHLGTSPYVIVGRPDHPYVQNPTPGDIDALVDTPVIIYRYGRESQRLAALFEHPRRPLSAPAHTTGSPTSALRLATVSDYLAVVPLMTARDHLETGRLGLTGISTAGWHIEVQLLSQNRDHPGVIALLDNLDRLRTAFSAPEQERAPS